ncbi:AraC family transcriptional regulator [Collimonas pratensis]|uniref:Bacterial regulatory helix-turn-helix s, AraC family protein n=1 Tax=Collimonas pratensis TaxID=279113 RepID=A0A127PXT0_9BURK|nr:AraC family transcriptional regulator [Collimonas pratensis]AMP02601.1 bacterial regulatory helix-turn-helix s, AraC family protein [Collimonas pratensis]
MRYSKGNGVTSEDKASITPNIALALTQVLSENGIAPARMLARFGLAVSDLEDPSFRLSHRQTGGMIAHAISLLPALPLGLLVGGKQTVSSLGMVGFAMMTSATFGEAIAHCLKYHKEGGTMVDIDFTATEQECTAVFSNPGDSAITAFLVEEVTAHLMNIGQAMLGTRALLQRMEFQYPAPPYAAHYRQLFNCPMQFSAPRNCIVVDASLFAVPLATHNPLAQRQALEHLQRMAMRDPDTPDLIESIESAFRRNWASPPNMAEIAGSLNLTERTLRRHLDQCGMSFQQIRAQMQERRARNLLATRQLTQSEIAEQLGFTDVRSFRRAFKAWTGETPGDYRSNHSASSYQ